MPGYPGTPSIQTVTDVLATIAPSVGNVAGYYVWLANTATGVNYGPSSKTDSSGNWSIASVPAGIYESFYGSESPTGTVPTQWQSTGVKGYLVALNPPYDTGAMVYNLKAYGLAYDGVTDDGAKITTAQNTIPAAGGTLFYPPGSVMVNTSVTPKSHVKHMGWKGTVTLKRNVVGDVFAKTGTLDEATFEGLNFDMMSTGWSAIDLIGSDAAGQITNVLIRDCSFKSPSTTWMVQINYIIADPVVPVQKNLNIKIEDCRDDATGGTFTLENFIFINCQDVVIQNSRFLNTPAALAAHVAIYGYCRNVRFLNNYIENWASARAVYVVQSDTVLFLGDNFRTTVGVASIIEIFNCRDVSIIGGSQVASNVTVGVNIHDFSGTTFDGHTNLYSATGGVRVQGVRFDVVSACVNMNFDQVQGQFDIFVLDNMASPLRSLFSTQNMPAAPSATTKRIFIKGNHVLSHSGFTAGAGCILIVGNAAATNGGFQTIVIQGNLIPASGVGGAGCDIEITGLADDVLIDGNRLLSPHPMIIAAACTNVKALATNIITLKTPTAGTLGANVTSVTPTGTNWRGKLVIVMAGALAANTRIATVTFTESPFGATVPRYLLVDQTSGAGLANVNFYVLATGTGQTFDLAANQALGAGTYECEYDVAA